MDQTLPFCPNRGASPRLLYAFLARWGSGSDSGAIFCFFTWWAPGRNHLVAWLQTSWQPGNDRLQTGDTRGRETVRRTWGWLLGGRVSWWGEEKEVDLRNIKGVLPGCLQVNFLVTGRTEYLSVSKGGMLDPAGPPDGGCIPDSAALGASASVSLRFLLQVGVLHGRGPLWPLLPNNQLAESGPSC